MQQLLDRIWSFEPVFRCVSVRSPFVLDSVAATEMPADVIEVWQSGETATGNPELDAVLEEFRISVVFSGAEPTLTAGVPVRIDLLAELLSETVEGLVVEPIPSAGDGDNILIDDVAEGIRVVLDKGFGSDCLAGCAAHHQWELLIPADDAEPITYVGETGDPLPVPFRELCDGP